MNFSYPKPLPGERVNVKIDAQGVVQSSMTERVRVMLDGHDLQVYVDPSHVTVVKPKINVGDVITGRQVRDIRWKRGTVLKYVGAADVAIDGGAYMLTAAGTWNCDRYTTGPIGFKSFGDRAKFKVIHAPGKP